MSPRNLKKTSLVDDYSLSNCKTALKPLSDLFNTSLDKKIFTTCLSEDYGTIYIKKKCKIRDFLLL